MTKKTSQKESLKRSGLLIIAFLGIVYLCFTYTSSRNHQSFATLQIAKTFEATISKKELQKLHAVAGDINTPEYKTLKNNLKGLVHVNQKLEFASVKLAYIYLKKANGKIYFVADSEPENSKNYSPPGQEYTKANAAYYQPFKDYKTTISNTVSDRWGNWISALILIKDPATNQIIAVLGMDFDANAWNYNILDEMGESCLVIALVVVIFLFFIKIRNNTISLKQELEERQKWDFKLKQHEEKYNEILRNTQDVFYQTDLQGIILEISSSIEQLTEYKKEELLGTNVLGVYENTEDRAMLLQSLKENGLIRDYEVKFNLKNNIQKTLLVNAKLIFDENGNPSHINGALRDITERKQYESRLKESEAFLKETQKIAAIGIYKLDISSGGQWSSSSILDEIFGIDSDYTKNVDGWKAIIHPEWLQIMTDYLQNEILGKKNTFDKEYKIVRVNDGEVRWVHGLGKLQFDTNGNLIKLIGTIQDITERKKIEEELTKAKEKAEESERLKSAFLANMSHEIRTPMNGILGFTELLKEPNLSGEKQTEYIDVIRKSGNRMLNIINDIIDISKIESGLMQVSFSETDINKNLEYIHTFFKHEAINQGIELSYKAELPQEAALINSDKDKILNILTNLVKNALKFTTKGSIKFGYRLKNNELEFFVKDTGEGIDKNQLDIVFERFRQTSESMSKNHEGAGLGLAITKSFVEMLGGRIWVKSEPGIGSTFYFTLPYNPMPKTVKIPKENQITVTNILVNNLKILIVEDDEISAKLLGVSVKNIGRTILRARNGIEAVDICRNSPDIDLILMDVQMPKMDGLQATAEIRKFNSKVIIIAQTAFVMPEDIEKTKQAGCSGYISKPVKKVELLKLINQHFKDKAV